jgi:hypothetical protein
MESDRATITWQGWQLGIPRHALQKDTKRDTKTRTVPKGIPRRGHTKTRIAPIITEIGGIRRQIGGIPRHALRRSYLRSNRQRMSDAETPSAGDFRGRLPAISKLSGVEVVGTLGHDEARS